jgi:predicted flap endonuclease-1-like 5' DNA nuclease
MRMGLLYRIIYAAHAKGTHHKLALDALAHLTGPDASAWRRVFLKHAETYVAGSKAPDDVFKDFKNHVLHPRDNFWGGAAVTARKWYDKTVEALRQESWSDAVHAAGILSHYVTDAVHPFHTGQSEAENSIHRAFEWSTAKSYEALKAVASGGAVGEVTVPDRADWLEEMLRQGATRVNRHYEKLIAHYDINTGVVDPPSGIDPVGQRIMGDLILHAARLHGVVLGRALAEAGVPPPPVSLSIDVVLATLKMPIKQLVKRLEDRAEQRAVERMYDELRQTGTVELTLSDDDRQIRQLYAAEVLQQAPQPKAAAGARSEQSLAERLAAARAEPDAHSADKPVAGDPEAKPSPQPKGGARPASAPATSVPTVKPRSAPATGPRLRLAPGDNVVDAPSIGPRMADRLGNLGVFTVQDLLDETPAALAQALSMPGVTADTIAAWQSQARLVCAVPGLTGTGAQLFVGAGYRDVEAIAAVDPETLSADLLAFAGSEPGRRVLRDGQPPDIARIKGWADAARMTVAA